MFKRKKSIDEAKQAVLTGAARDFEVTVVDLAKKSERKAWWVAGGFGVMSLLLAGGYMLVMPLKQQVPYLVLADPYRGTSSVARLDGLNPTLTASEAINKSNVAHFVISRESYDWDLVGRRDKRVVYSMAVGNALKEYKELYSASNPQNPDTVYGRDVSVRVKILSTILTWAEPAKNADQNLRIPIAATVRFERWLFNTSSGRSRFLDTQIASMKIGYDSNLQMNEDGRIENPLGFRVSSYRVDPDALGSNTSAEPPALPASNSPLTNTAQTAVDAQNGPPVPAVPQEVNVRSAPLTPSLGASNAATQ